MRIQETLSKVCEIGDLVDTRSLEPESPVYSKLLRHESTDFLCVPLYDTAGQRYTIEITRL